MKKRWTTALITLAIAGVATTAIGDGQLRISMGADRINSELPASEANAVQELVNKLGGFTTYDRKSGRMTVEKPKVNILILEGIQQSRNKNIVFTNPIKSYTDKDVPRSFGVFVEVDQAPEARQLEMKLVLIGPNGKEVEEGNKLTYSTKNGTSFYFSQPFISTKLSQFGTYKVQLLMRSEKYKDYVVVGENSFTVGR
ncbi:hypothetical protein G3578_00495 [Brevibacillus sp. SYP-B805]|uniref:hypothetical protein n=1 Tax=Brevibacillus sp. SYP-B805 TaxID=1578199 RepID=UPI0013EA63B3|nr:hypothetical protein [Brevibacillus sp. SYP-B805]NGQ93646.1 hypothetical protein [Brevibacillus sp. SYP-B805]